MNLSASMRLYLSGNVVTATGESQPLINIASSLVAGSTGAGKFDLLYADQRTIAASGTPDVINLTSGVLLGDDKSSLVFVHIVFVLLINRSATSKLTFGSGTQAWDTMFTGAVLLPSEDVTNKASVFLMRATGATAYAVTAGTKDRIQAVTDIGTNVPYTAFIGGRSV